MKITTNNHWRSFVYRYDVPEKVLKDDFDYQDETVVCGFFQYKGTWYHLDMFMRFGYPDSETIEGGWQGYLNDSISTGVVIQVSDCGDMYEVGYFTS